MFPRTGFPGFFLKDGMLIVIPNDELQVFHAQKRPRYIIVHQHLAVFKRYDSVLTQLEMGTMSSQVNWLRKDSPETSLTLPVLHLTGQSRCPKFDLQAVLPEGSFRLEVLFSPTPFYRRDLPTSLSSRRSLSSLSHISLSSFSLSHSLTLSLISLSHLSFSLSYLSLIFLSSFSHLSLSSLSHLSLSLSLSVDCGQTPTKTSPQVGLLV